jgi:predicted DNA-binding transcriptional regulator AlpA
MNIKKVIERKINKHRTNKAIEDKSIAIGFLTTNEICSVLGTSRLMLYRIHASGEIKPIETGGFVFWDVVEVNMALHGYRKPSAA